MCSVPVGRHGGWFQAAHRALLANLGDEPLKKQPQGGGWNGALGAVYLQKHYIIL
jgi:hypothetical protein